MRSTVIAVRVEPRIKAAARKAATDDHRSVASLLEKLLIEYLTDNHYLGRMGTGSGT